LSITFSAGVIGKVSPFPISGSLSKKYSTEDILLVSDSLLLGVCIKNGLD